MYIWCEELGDFLPYDSDDDQFKSLGEFLPLGETVSFERQKGTIIAYCLIEGQLTYYILGNDGKEYYIPSLKIKTEGKRKTRELTSPKAKEVSM